MIYMNVYQLFYHSFLKSYLILKDFKFPVEYW